MQAIRRHKWVFVIIVLLLAGFMVGRSLYQSKYSLTCTLYQISSDKIDTPVYNGYNFANNDNSLQMMRKLAEYNRIIFWNFYGSTPFNPNHPTT